MFFLMAHVDGSSLENEILNLECVVRPFGSKRDAIPDDATARTMIPSDLRRFMIVCHKKILSVHPYSCTKTKA